MKTINAKKRKELFSKFQLATPGLDSQRTGLVEDIVRRLQDKQIVGLKGFFHTGKTTVLNSVRRKWNPDNWRELDVHFLYCANNSTAFQTQEANFREHGIALFDEGGAVYGYRLARKAFVDLVQRLHADGIPVLIAYPKTPRDKVFERDLPNMNTIILPPALSINDAMQALSVPFEDTGVELSDSAKERIVELSEGHISVLCHICHNLLFSKVQEIMDTTERIIIDMDPQITLREFLRFNLSGPPATIIEDGLRRGLTKREKALLERLVNGKNTSGYEPEIKELKGWKLIGEGLEIGSVIRTFVECGYHRDPR